MTVAKEVLDVALRKGFDNVRWLVDDVGDDDCFWEPGTPCWSVRPRAEAGRAWGTGDFVCEDAWPPPDPLPLTTIAWRMAHLAAWTDVYRSWTFEGGRLNLNELDVPGTRDGLADWVFAAQDRFGDAVDALTEGELTELRPAHFGAHLPVHVLVSVMAVEHVHHGAEIGLLRDLRRGHARVQPPSVKEP